MPWFIGPILSVIIIGIPVRLLYDFWLKAKFSMWLARTTEKRARRRLNRTMLKFYKIRQYQERPLDAIADAVLDVLRFVISIWAILFGLVAAHLAIRYGLQHVEPVGVGLAILGILFGMLLPRGTQDILDSLTHEAREKATRQLLAEGESLLERFPALVNNFPAPLTDKPDSTI